MSLSRTVAPGLLAFAASLAFAPVSHAAVSWSNPAGGSAAVGSNWSGGAPPTASDAALFNIAGTYTVTFPSTVATTQSLSGGIGTPTLSMLSPHTTGFVNVGTDLVSAHSLTISGTVTTTGGGGAIVLGQFAGSGSGSLTLTGSSTLLRTTGTGDFIVGQAGTGSLTVASARAESGDDVFIGNGTGSSGTVLVSGTGASLTTTSASSGDVVVGIFGSGSLTARNGGLLDVGHDLQLAQNSSSSGVLTLTTLGGFGTAVVHHDCFIARNNNAGAAGTATFTVIGSVANVRGATMIGDPDGGMGTLSLQGGIFTTHDLLMESGHSTLDFQDGALVIDSGTFVPLPGNFLISPSSTASSPVLRLQSGASATFPAALILCNGSNQSARVEVLSGSVLNLSSVFNMCAASATGANTSTLVDGAGSLLHNTSNINVGNAGTAQLDVSAGAHADASQLNIGLSAATGTVNASGAGTQFALGNSVSVGGSSSGPGGVGHLNLSSNATMTAPSANLYAGSSLSVDHASLTLTGAMNALGLTTLNAGTITAGSITAGSAAVFNANGRIDSALNNAAVGTGQINLTGPLDVGPAGLSGVFSWTGQLNLGANPLTIRTSLSPIARLGDVTMSGGSITPIPSNLRLSLSNGDSLSGSGSINGPIEISSGAPVNATGAAGLTFNGMISMLITPSVTMTGTQYTFGPSGGFTGAGAINAKVSNTGTITATGSLTMGDGSQAGYSGSSGTINVGIHHVSISDSSGCSIGQCTIGGGNLELLNPGSTQFNSTNSHLKGFGTITVPTFNNINSGQISPGNPGSTGTGTLIFTGNYASGDTLNIPGTINIDIRDSESNDRLVIGGSAAINGFLNVALTPGFTPAPGTFFTILNAASVTGTFSFVSLPPGAAVIYGPTSVQILFPCSADFNVDGVVDFFDYLDFVDAFSSGDSSADFNGDSSIDFFDYLDFVDAYASAC